MSEITLFRKDQLPAYLRDKGVDATTKALMGSGGGKRISIRGGVFRKIVNGQEVMRSEERSMNVVIVRAMPDVNRTYYEGTYKEGDKTPPSCWSSNGTAPDSDVKHPQSASCASCPQNVKGSGQGDSRACRFSQRIAVVLDGELDGDVLQLTLPAQSIFGKADPTKMPLQQYAKSEGQNQDDAAAGLIEEGLQQKGF